VRKIASESRKAQEKRDQNDSRENYVVGGSRKRQEQQRE